MTLSHESMRRLEQLASLKDKGILTETEFEDAKRRLLSGEETATPSDGAPRPAVDQRLIQWSLLATGILLLVLGLAFFGGRSESDVVAEPLNSAEMEIDETVPESGISDLGELCGSDATYAGLKDIIFDKASELYGGPGPLDSLRKSVRLRMQVPTVEGIDEELIRADCSGHGVIDLPPDVMEAFGGKRTLEADLDYAIQPAADGSGAVLRVGGIGDLVTALASAASLVRSSQVASAGGPQLQKTYNPSFDCGRRLTNVERMVCQSEQLAALDRALSDRYFELRKSVSKAEWKVIMDSQRQFLADRGRCADEACIERTYVTQSRLLDRFEAEAEPSVNSST